MIRRAPSPEREKVQGSCFIAGSLCIDDCLNINSVLLILNTCQIIRNYLQQLSEKTTGMLQLSHIGLRSCTQVAWGDVNLLVLPTDGICVPTILSWQTLKYVTSTDKS